MSARLSVALALLVACKDGGNAPATGTTPSGSGSAMQTAPRPRLPLGGDVSPERRMSIEHGHAGIEQAFQHEPVDAQWAPTMAAEIKTRAQWATVECRTQQCRVSFIAPTAEEAVAKTDELRAIATDTGAPLASWSPTPPLPRPDGSLEVRLYAFVKR